MVNRSQVLCWMVITIVAMSTGRQASGQAAGQAGDGEGSATAAPAPLVAPPDTPAGRLLGDWLLALHSGEAETIRRFVVERFDSPPGGQLPVDAIVENELNLLRNTGGFTLHGVTSPDRWTVDTLLRAKRTGYWMGYRVVASRRNESRLAGMGGGPIHTPAQWRGTKRLSDEQIAANIDAVISALVESDEFSGTVMLSRGDEVVYQRAAGLASRAWGEPNRIDTKMNLASITKMFTATAIGQLVDRGLLRFDTKVGEVLSDYPNRAVAEKVTVHHLLTHTAGITGAQGSKGRLIETTRSGMRDLSDYVATFAPDPLEFEPGSRFEYSNYGYILLGRMIEAASGLSYPEYLRRNLFEPAGMTGSGAFDLESEPENLATGYVDSWDGGERRSNIFLLPVVGLPCGGVYSTAADMHQFHLALRNGTLVSEATREHLWKADGGPASPNGGYRYGFMPRDFEGTRIIGHGGGWDGVNSEVEMYPDLGITWVILSNYDAELMPLTMLVREWVTQGR